MLSQAGFLKKASSANPNPPNSPVYNWSAKNPLNNGTLPADGYAQSVMNDTIVAATMPLSSGKTAASWRSSVDGYPAWQFGSALNCSYDVSNSQVLNIGNDYTIGVVCKITAVNPHFDFYAVNTIVNFIYAQMAIDHPTSGRLVLNMPSNPYTSWFTIFFRVNGAAQKIFFNNTTTATNNGALTVSLTGQTGTIFAPQGVDAYIRQMTIWPVLSDAQVTTSQAYFATEWGL